MNPFGLAVVAIGAFIAWLGITARAGQIVTHVKTNAGSPSLAPPPPVGATGTIGYYGQTTQGQRIT